MVIGTVLLLVIEIGLILIGFVTYGKDVVDVEFIFVLTNGIE
jgi:hypothetical protein